MRQPLTENLNDIIYQDAAIFDLPASKTQIMRVW
jgi:hypothetical protein